MRAFIFTKFNLYQGKRLFSVNKTPAATAEPITPATFGPIANIRSRFSGPASTPTFWLTRAAMGTADTPAEPISGLIFVLEKRFISFINKKFAVVVNSGSSANLAAFKALNSRKLEGRN